MQKFLKKNFQGWVNLSDSDKLFFLRAMAIDDLPSSGSILNTMASMAAPHLIGLAEKYAPMLAEKLGNWAGEKISSWWSGDSRKSNIQPTEATSYKNPNQTKITPYRRDQVSLGYVNTFLFPEEYAKRRPALSYNMKTALAVSKQQYTMTTGAGGLAAMYIFP
jgi:hypothetical protein